MAETDDLGVIQASRTPDTADPSQVDILGGVLEAAQTGVDQFKAGVLRQARKDMDAAMDEEVQAAAGVPEDSTFTAAPGNIMGDAAALSNNIRSLEARVKATSGSSRLRAEQRLRAEVDKFARKYPGLRDELAGELGNFQRIDPEYAMLANIDARNEIINKEAAQELAEIRDHAYGSVGSGGLGLQPGLHPFGSPEFTLFYAKNAQIVNDSNQKELALENSKLDTDVTVRGKADTFTNWLTGASAPLRQSVQVALDTQQDVQVALLDPTKAGNRERIAQWEAGGKATAIANVESARLRLLDEFNSSFTVTEQSSPEFAQARAIFEQELSAIDRYLTGLRENDGSIVNAYKAWDTYKRMEIEAADPQAANLNRVFNDWAKIIEATGGSFDGADKLLKNDVAHWTLNSLGSVADYLGVELAYAGGGELDRLGSASIRDGWRSRSISEPDTLNSGQNSRQAKQTGAYQVLKLGQEIASSGADIGPNAALQATSARGRALSDIAMYGPTNVDPKLAKEAMWVIGDPNVFAQAVKSREINPEMAIAMGEQAREVAAAWEDNRIASYQEQVAKQLPGSALFGAGFTVADVVDIDLDKSAVENGRVRFVVNPARLERLIADSFPASKGQGAGAAQARMEINKTVASLNATVGQDLRGLAHADALAQGLDAPDYLTTWKTGRFEEYFGALEE